MRVSNNMLLRAAPVLAATGSLAAAAGQANATASLAELCTYTVVPGDYCWKIAQQFKINVEELRRINPEITYKHCSLFPGDRLRVPCPKAKASSARPHVLSTQSSSKPAKPTSVAASAGLPVTAAASAGRPVASAGLPVAASTGLPVPASSGLPVAPLASEVPRPSVSGGFLWANTTSTAATTVPMTTSTVYTTSLRTVISCEATADVTPCAEATHVETVTVPLYTTVCPADAAPSSTPAVTVPAGAAQTVTATVTKMFTVTSCAPTVTACAVGSIATEVSTTVYCPGVVCELPTPAPVPEATPAKDCTGPACPPVCDSAAKAHVSPIEAQVPSSNKNAKEAAHVKAQAYVAKAPEGAAEDESPAAVKVQSPNAPNKTVAAAKAQTSAPVKASGANVASHKVEVVTQVKKPVASGMPLNSTAGAGPKAGACVGAGCPSALTGASGSVRASAALALAGAFMAML